MSVGLDNCCASDESEVDDHGRLVLEQAAYILEEDDQHVGIISKVDEAYCNSCTKLYQH